MAERGELFVDPVSMQSAALAAEGAGTAIAEVGQAAASPIRDAVDAHPGMLAAIAMAQAVDRWSAAMTALGDEIGGVAGKVRDTLAAIEAQERSAAQVFGSASLPG